MHSLKYRKIFGKKGVTNRSVWTSCKQAEAPAEGDNDRVQDPVELVLYVLVVVGEAEKLLDGVKELEIVGLKEGVVEADHDGVSVRERAEPICGTLAYQTNKQKNRCKLVVYCHSLFFIFQTQTFALFIKVGEWKPEKDADDGWCSGKRTQFGNYGACRVYIISLGQCLFESI